MKSCRDARKEYQHVSLLNAPRAKGFHGITVATSLCNLNFFSFQSRPFLLVYYGSVYAPRVQCRRHQLVACGLRLVDVCLLGTTYGGMIAFWNMEPGRIEAAHKPSVHGTRPAASQLAQLAPGQTVCMWQLLPPACISVGRTQRSPIDRNSSSITKLHLDHFCRTTTSLFPVAARVQRRHEHTTLTVFALLGTNVLLAKSSISVVKGFREWSSWISGELRACLMNEFHHITGFMLVGNLLSNSTFFLVLQSIDKCDVRDLIARFNKC